MTMKSLLALIGVGVLTLSAACARDMPVGPDQLTSEVSGTALTSPDYVVTLRPDLTASPASLSLTAGYQVLFVNSSGQPVKVHSYDCTEFTYMSLNVGYSK